MFFAGKQDIARRMVEAGDDGINFIFCEHFCGSIEIRRKEEFDVWKGLDGFFCNLVLGEFGEDNFHSIIITQIVDF